jgi:hypothetical protein
VATEKKGADAGQAEVQRIHDEAVSKGFLGERPEGSIPNEAYTLRSGPDAPSPLEEHIAISQQRLAAQKRSPAEEVK